MKIPYTITARSISFVVKNRPRTIDASHANFQALRDHLRSGDHDLDVIEELGDMKLFVIRKSFGRVEIGETEVRLDGKVLHHTLCDKLVDMVTQGDDVEPLSLFLGNLMNNPIESARAELYQWLEAGNAPITPEGNFLAYKAVRSNYKDKHSGTFDNSVGKVLEMPRTDVDPDRNNECSRGLHFCQWGYLKSFMHNGDRLMIVEIDPADVVAIPRDYNHQKGRTWRYKVVGEVPQDEVSKEFFNGQIVDRRYSVTPIDWQPPPPPAEAIIYGKFDETAGAAILNALDDGAFNKASSLNQAMTVDTSVKLSAPTPRAASADEAFVMARTKQPLTKQTLASDQTPSTGTVPASSDVFKTSDGKMFTPDQIKEAAKKGQRPGASFLGVSKSTFQGWLKKLGIA